jgi:PP-loop superfamily ATP-utilizing enzyme
MSGDKAIEAISIVKEEISRTLDFDGRAVLLFSGGRDSTAVAAAYCNAFPQSRLHLLLIDNGLLSRLANTKRQVQLLRSLFPETEISFETKRVSQMMREAGMQQIERDFKEYKFSSLLICVSCKLIMNFSAIRFADELGIKLILDGFANRQKDYPEQTDIFMEYIRNVYRKTGLVYLSPLYDFLADKKTVNIALSEMNVNIHKQEPYCMFADAFSTANNEEISKYIVKTVEIIRELDPVLHC